MVANRIGKQKHTLNILAKGRKLSVKIVINFPLRDELKVKSTPNNKKIYILY
jgi:hypothetical protein